MSKPIDMTDITNNLNIYLFPRMYTLDWRM